MMGGKELSESREKKRRYNERLDYIRKFSGWLAGCPPKWRVFRFMKWLGGMPDPAGLFREDCA